MDACPRRGVILFPPFLLLVLIAFMPVLPTTARAGGLSVQVRDPDDNRELNVNTALVGEISPANDIDRYVFSVGRGDKLSIRADVLSGSLSSFGFVMLRPDGSRFGRTVSLVPRALIYTMDGSYDWQVGRYTLEVWSGNLTALRAWTDRNTGEAPQSVTQSADTGRYVIGLVRGELQSPIPVPTIQTTATLGYDIQGSRRPSDQTPLRIRFESQPPGGDVEQVCIEAQSIGGDDLPMGDLLFGVTRAGAVGCNPAAETDLAVWPGVLARNDRGGAAEVAFDTLMPVPFGTDANRLMQLPLEVTLRGWATTPVFTEGVTIKVQVPVRVPVRIEAAYKVELKREGLPVGGAATLADRLLQPNVPVAGAIGETLMVPADSVIRVNFLDGSVGIIFFKHPDVYQAHAPVGDALKRSAADGMAVTQAPEPPSGVPWSIATNLLWSAEASGFAWPPSSLTGNALWDDLINDVLADVVSQRLSIVKTLFEFFQAELGGGASDDALYKVRVR